MIGEWMYGQNFTLHIGKEQNKQGKDYYSKSAAGRDSSWEAT